MNVKISFVLLYSERQELIYILNGGLPIAILNEQCLIALKLGNKIFFLICKY